MSENADLLREVLRRLDTLVAIQKLASQEALGSLKSHMSKDRVATAILSRTGDPVAYTDLAKAVAQASGAADRTVKRRIAELVGQGLIVATRRGKQVYYENAGIL